MSVEDMDRFSEPTYRIHIGLRRAVDVLGAGGAAFILAPLMLIVALAIWIESGRPILFSQIRLGQYGRPFRMYKFRKFGPDCHSQGCPLTMEADGRLTKVGRVLAVSKLDELPQLWNILRGDMSLVGPRPPLPQEVEQYQPWQRRRLRMRPGLTCLWALEGRSQLRFERLTRLDLLYIDNWSVWLDLKILLKTIPTVLSGRGAH